ncbi:MAG TPA: 50S ribosomal protein L11 methyltransferase [Rhizomicrobium sp.]|nr:50S ribosomal protein L11 methyltransferase [Rhizomicrobium sp.]
MTPAEFILANTESLAPPLVPEIRLHLATEIVPLWRKSEEELEAMGVPPPYWAFAWAGGQALARYILDTPGTVRGKSVLDFGSGSGLVGIAAMKAGAASVLAADIDAYAAAAIALNAKANDVVIDTTTDDLVGRSEWDVILVGDMCYERPLAERLLGWLRGSGANALLGDPGRSYFPKSGVERLALYNVQVTRDLEDREIRETGVYRLTGAGPV